ncbi:hypothetical protein GPX89_25785 [Nocardia sp. ET3-3]|uniref:BD-FAE-like domain-containing protein n=2 Tax=Nocardia terrae TaxID=2675851 RepID=A0A7K1V2H8_9NOCA|nr:hypothetical protein [Nocardia terrae]
MLKGIAAMGVLPFAAIACGTRSGQHNTSAENEPDALAFDPNRYTTAQKTVTTSAGSKSVTYRSYTGISYVSKPVDQQHQTLNVSVPVEIDGKAVDASGAPILLSNSIAGYMSSVAGSGMGGAMPSGAMPSGGMPGGGFADGANRASNPDLALAAGYVVVEPGTRGRDLVNSAGEYYGVAPAAIVDLKAVVRYVRHNAGRIPGNTDWIVSTGVSAGGAMSALLGASTDDPLYDPYLREIGAAQASDAVFASADYCPIADLEHADMAYEWNWGANALSTGGLVDQSVSGELKTAFASYQAGLKLMGENSFGPLTADNYGDYLTRTYLQSSATKYLAALSDSARADYLGQNPWITWSAAKATFAWNDYLAHVGARKKNVPAFDAFDLSAGENNEFGLGTTKARHFTPYSLRHATGNASAELDADLPDKLNLMNPMHFLDRQSPNRTKNWWIRVGTKDSDTSLTIVGNLAARLHNLGDNVNAAMYWDAGHGANEDAEDFITWIGTTTGYHR